MSEIPSSHREEKNIPDEVYQNLSFANGMGLLLTMTPGDDRIGIPGNPESQPKQEGISFVLENKGRFSVIPEISREEVFAMVRLSLPKSILDGLRSFKDNHSLEENISFIADLLRTNNPEVADHFLLRVQERKEETGSLRMEKEEYTPLVIKGVIYEEDRFTLQDGIPYFVQEKINELLEAYKEIAVPNGTTLYTYLSTPELREVQLNGRMIVRAHTDFVNSQEKLILLDCGEDTDEPLIRLRVQHPFFRQKGAYGRVGAMISHMADVEFFHEGKWISPNDLSILEMQKGL